MTQIRGWVGGAVEERVVVTEKWDVSSVEHDSVTYWLTWIEKDSALSEDNKVNTTKAHWEGLEEGDALSIIHTPRDSKPYLRDGIYASNGNLIFDFVLLGSELVGIIGILVYSKKSKHS